MDERECPLAVHRFIDCVAALVAIWFIGWLCSGCAAHRGAYQRAIDCGRWDCGEDVRHGND